MKLTDTEALKELNRVKSGALWESISEYPEEERDGRSDMEMLADEVSWLIYCTHEEGCGEWEQAIRAKEIMKETKNGRVMPLLPDLQPKYKQYEVENARALINENRRIENLMKRLNNNGYYGQW